MNKTAAATQNEIAAAIFICEKSPSHHVISYKQEAEQKTQNRYHDTANKKNWVSRGFRYLYVVIQPVLLDFITGEAHRLKLTLKKPDVLPFLRISAIFLYLNILIVAQNHFFVNWIRGYYF